MGSLSVATLLKGKSRKVRMDQGSRSQKRLNVLSLRLIVIKVVRYGSTKTNKKFFQVLPYRTEQKAHSFSQKIVATD